MVPGLYARVCWLENVLIGAQWLCSVLVGIELTMMALQMGTLRSHNSSIVLWLIILMLCVAFFLI